MNNKEPVSQLSLHQPDAPAPRSPENHAGGRGAPVPAAGRGLSEGQKIVFLKRENQCDVCGGGLSTEVEYIPLTRFMVERAVCRGCKTLNRVKNHSLQ